MITKELLSLVLGRGVKNVDPNIIIDDKDIRGHSYLMVVLEDEIDQYGISVAYITDHICRLCKEWCLEQGYTLRTEAIDDDVVYWVIAVVEYTDDAEYLRFSSLDTDSELEAVLLATVYVANEKGLL